MLVIENQHLSIPGKRGDTYFKYVSIYKFISEQIILNNKYVYKDYHIYIIMVNEMIVFLNIKISKQAINKARYKAKLIDVDIDTYIQSIILNDTSDLILDEKQTTLNHF